MDIRLNTTLQSLGKAQRELTASMSRITSGVAVQKPSDDPLAFVQGLSVSATISRNGAQLNALALENSRLVEFEIQALGINDSFTELQDVILQSSTPLVKPEDLVALGKVFSAQLDNVRTKLQTLQDGGQLTQAQSDSILGTLQTTLDSLTAGQRPAATAREDLASLVQDNLVYVAKIGGKQRANDLEMDTLENMTAQAKIEKGRLLDTDIAAESIKFNALNTQVQATYAAIAKLGNQSLFDYIG